VLESDFCPSLNTGIVNALKEEAADEKTSKKKKKNLLGGHGYLEDDPSAQDDAPLTIFVTASPNLANSIAAHYTKLRKSLDSKLPPNWFELPDEQLEQLLRESSAAVGQS